VLLLLSLSVAGMAEDCGNTGQDYYYARYISAGVGGAYQLMDYPTYLFKPGDCAPVGSASCPNGTCFPTFESGENKTYEMNCAVTNLTSVNAIVPQLHNFSLSYSAACSCTLPPTPTGKYLNGYTLTLYGDVQKGTVSDGTVVYKGCDVSPSYQDEPLSIGSIFSQIFILNGAGAITANIFFISSIILMSILLV